jgi:tetratricopeptide (TPR) repeat protein
VAESLVADVRAAGHRSLLARSLLVQGKLAWRARDYSVAEPTLHDAAAVAEGARDDRTAADAWSTLVYLIGVQLSRPAEARTWARYAQAAIERAGGDDELEAARLRALAVVVWRRLGELDEARPLLERSRELYSRVKSARWEFQLAMCDEDLAGILFDRGDPAAALVLHRQNAEVRERLFGPEHPSLAASFVNQGEDLTLLGRPDEAIPLIRRAIAILAPQHSKGVDAYHHHRLAAALRARGDVAAALTEDREALAGNARAGEAGGYWESWALVGQGLDLLALGRADEAVDSLRRAVEQRRTNAPPPERSEARFALAQALDAAGKRKAARESAEEARRDLLGHAGKYGGVFSVRLTEIDRWLREHPEA